MVFWMFSVHSQLHLSFISKHKIFRAMSARAVSAPSQTQRLKQRRSQFSCVKFTLYFVLTKLDKLPLKWDSRALRKSLSWEVLPSPVWYGVHHPQVFLVLSMSAQCLFENKVQTLTLSSKILGYLFPSLSSLQVSAPLCSSSDSWRHHPPASPVHPENPPDPTGRTLLEPTESNGKCCVFLVMYRESKKLKFRHDAKPIFDISLIWYSPSSVHWTSMSL